MIPKRPFWLAMGAALGAGSSLWLERRVRRTVHEAASRLQPDALASEIGRSARLMAESTSERVRSAVSAGRTEMQQHEEELWRELAERRMVPGRPMTPEDDEWLQGSIGPIGSSTAPSPSPAPPPAPLPLSVPPPASGPSAETAADPEPKSRGRRRKRVGAAKSASHLGN
jgi:hypothetical protein